MAKDGLTQRLERLSKWMVFAAAVCYASGLLVVYTFQGTFQARDHVTDFLRLKYIYVGILCWLFPVGILLPLGAFYELNRGMKKNKICRPWLDVGVSFFLSQFVPMVIYTMVEFARPSNTVSLWWVALSMTTAFLGFWWADYFKTETQRKILRYTASISIPLLFVWAGGSFTWWVLSTVVVKGGYIYIIFVLCAISVFPRTRHWAKQRPDHVTRSSWNKVTRHAWIIASTLSGLLFYLAVLAYASWVYPYVPATRGGGDYSVLRDARILLKDEGELSAPHVTPVTRKEALEGKLFKIIDETEDSLFVAAVDSHGGPSNWRQSPYDTGGVQHVPEIIEIPKSQINIIEYVDQDPYSSSTKALLTIRNIP